MKQLLSSIKTSLSHMNHTLTLSDLENILACLELDLSLNQTMQLLGFNESHAETSIKVITQSNQGSLNDIDVLKRHINIRKHIQLLIKGVFTQNLYPLTLIFISYFMLWFHVSFFSGFVRSLLNDSGVSYHGVLLKGITILILFVKTVVFILSGLCIYFNRNPKHRILTYGFIKETVIAPVYINSISFLFSETLLCLWKSHQSMKHVLEMMRTYDFEPECQWVAFQIDANLETGQDLSDSLNVPMLNPFLVGMIKSGLYSNQLIENLERYAKISSQVLNKHLARLHRYLNLLAFIDVLVVVVLYYHLLYQTLRIVEVINT